MLIFLVYKPEEEKEKKLTLNQKLAIVSMVITFLGIVVEAISMIL